MTQALAEHLTTVAPLLAGFYALCAALNLGAGWYAWRGRRPLGFAPGWLGAAAVFAVLAGLCLAGRPPQMPGPAKAALDAAMGPVVLFLGTLVVLAGLYAGRRFFAVPAAAMALLDASLLLLGMSLADPVFAAFVGKADHVPIVAMVFLLGFLLWVATYQAVENDRRRGIGGEPVEKRYADKVLVWPDLVYVELIAMVLVSALLIVWSVALAAPLEEPANPAVTPNPSKAPWYFLGLQELLLYADAWYVGFIVPCLIIFGLMALPYLDVNPKGNGYYTIAERRREYLVFLFGFLMLWVLPILVGTFMRGPNWSFFGPYEPRNPQKMVAQPNVTLSEYFWVRALGRPQPAVDPNAGGWLRGMQAAVRELPGVVFLAAYFAALPVLLGRTWLKPVRCTMGRCRYWMMLWLLLLMFTLPLKMILRWTLNLSYLVSIPEFQLNF